MVLIPIDGDVDGRWINPEQITFIRKAYDSNNTPSNKITEIYFASEKDLSSISIHDSLQVVLGRLK